MNINKRPFSGHHLGKNYGAPITFEVVPYENSWPHLATRVKYERSAGLLRVGDESKHLWFGLVIWAFEPLLLVESKRTLQESSERSHLCAKAL